MSGARRSPSSARAEMAFRNFEGCHSLGTKPMSTSANYPRFNTCVYYFLSQISRWLVVISPHYFPPCGFQIPFFKEKEAPILRPGSAIPGVCRCAAMHPRDGRVQDVPPGPHAPLGQNRGAVAVRCSRVVRGAPRAMPVNHRFEGRCGLPRPLSGSPRGGGHSKAPRSDPACLGGAMTKVAWVLGLGVTYNHTFTGRCLSSE